MSHTVTIEPSGHKFIIEDSDSILDAGLRHGFHLPYGCRNGACGSCKGSLLAGSVTHAGNATALSALDISNNKILFCVAHADSDIRIECREIGAAKDIVIRTLPCRVHKLQRLTHNVMLVQLKLPANERLQFLPGQYLDVLMKNGQRRSFSIANAPHDDAFLHLHIRLVAGGEFTEHVFNTMKEKDILRIEAPLGYFFVREDSQKPLLFIASGTGFAPIRSIIEHLHYQNCKRPIILYWGGRKPEDLYLTELAQQWEREIADFRYVPVVEHATEDWQGATGLVTQAVERDIQNLSEMEVYACGSPKMVNAARELGQKLGLPDDAFFADAFVFQQQPDYGTSRR